MDWVLQACRAGIGSLFIVFYQLFVPEGAAITGVEMKKKAIEVLAGFLSVQRVLLCLYVLAEDLYQSCRCRCRLSWKS